MSAVPASDQSGAVRAGEELDVARLDAWLKQHVPGLSGLTVLALLSIYAMLERREAFRPRPAGPSRPAVVEDRQRPSILRTIRRSL